MKSKHLTPKQKHLLGIVFVLLEFLLFVFAAYSFLPVHENANPPITWGWGIDWKGNIREASLDLLAGRTPYTSIIRCLPPWVYLITAPIAMLPPDLGAAVIFVLTYMILSYVLYRMNAKTWVILVFMFNTFTFVNAKNGNLDSLAMLGFILPPQIGLFFVLIKPQIGAGIALFWLIESWRKGKYREVLRVYTPVSAAYVISFLFYGLWPLKLIGMTQDVYNASLWPFGIPVGIILLYKGIRERNALFAIGASPFLAPYVNITSFVVALMPFIPNPILIMISAALSWI